MSKPRQGLLIVTVLILIGIGAWWWFGEGDEARIHKNLDTMIELVTKQGEENPLLGMVSLAKLEDFLVESPSIEIQGRRSRLTDRRELIAQAASLRTYTRTIQAQVEERELEIANNRNQAEMSGIARVRLEYNNGEQKLYAAHYRLNWIKDEEGDWRLETTQVMEVLVNGEAATAFPPDFPEKRDLGLNPTVF